MKLSIIADPHYYSKKLGVKGRAYELRSDSDQKCLGETSEIIDAAFRELSDSDTDAVLIAGDLTDNGEMVSHLEFREKLRSLAKKKPVYVITATHDWCSNGKPHRYDGSNVYTDVEVMPADCLKDFYREFGLEQAYSSYTTEIGTLSCAVDISENVRLLLLNDDKNGNDGAGFTEAHFQWIEKQLADAKKKDKCVICMQHHLMLPHLHPLISESMTEQNYREVATRLADAGLKYCFAGHSHMLDVDTFTTKKGNRLTEVNVSAISGYPPAICEVNIDENTQKIQVDIKYLQGWEDYLRKHALNVIDKALTGVAYGDKKEFEDRLKALGFDSPKLLKHRMTVRKIARWYLDADVETLAKTVNRLSLKKLLNINEYPAVARKPLISITHEMFLNVFDGERNRYPKDSDYYRFMQALSKVPMHFKKDDKTFKALPEVVDILVAGNPKNHFPCTL